MGFLWLGVGPLAAGAVADMFGLRWQAMIQGLAFIHQLGSLLGAYGGGLIYDTTFLHNHADGIAAMDLFVVPTISFRLLYGLLIMGTADDKFCGLASQLTPLQNGSQIRSRKHAVGNKLPAT